MLTFSEPSEGVGDAKGMTKIKANNFQKYKKHYSKNTVLKIEELTWPLLKKYGYDFEYNGQVKTLSASRLAYYKFVDIINRTKYDLKELGFKKFIYIFKTSIVHFKK